MPKGTYEPIFTTTLGSPGAVTFSSIPQTYTDLILVCNAKRNLSGAGAASITVQFNNDTSSGLYSTTLLYTGGGALSSGANSLVYAGSANQSNDTEVGIVYLNIFNYSRTNGPKAIVSRWGGAQSMYPAMAAGLWRNNNAINRIDLSCANSFTSGSNFTLYGIKAE